MADNPYETDGLEPGAGLWLQSACDARTETSYRAPARTGRVAQLDLPRNGSLARGSAVILRRHEEVRDCNQPLNPVNQIT